MKLVSACLLGSCCRYDGSSKPNEKLMQLYREGGIISVCPELFGGLFIPRDPAETTRDGKYVLCREAKVITKNGIDVTEQFILGARKTLELALEFHIEEIIFKSRSPSCGCGKIYDGTFSNRLVDGDGVTTALLKQHGIKVITEEDI